MSLEPFGAPAEICLHLLRFVYLRCQVSGGRGGGGPDLLVVAG